MKNTHVLDAVSFARYMHEQNVSYPGFIFIKLVSTLYFSKSSFKNFALPSSLKFPIKAQFSPSFAAATSPVAQGPPPLTFIELARIFVSSAGNVSIT